MSPHPAAGLPAQILHYQLGDKLGEGGTGEVFSAWDQQLHRHVAIKRLKPALSELDANLLSEARLGASLSHPAFVRIHTVLTQDSRTWLVMERVQGQTLTSLLQHGALPAWRAISLVAQAASALATAHQAGLVHGDLKPANLMLTDDDQLRILDFGLAQQTDPLATHTGGVTEPSGTLAYMAPELLRGQPPSPASDIYALGLVLYELLNGARPYAELQGIALATARLQASTPPPLPKNLAPDLQALIQAMLAPVPSARQASMAEVARKLQRHAAQDTERPNSVPAPRRTFHLWGGVALLLTLSLAMAWRPTPPAPATALEPQQQSDQVRLQRGEAWLRHFDRDGALASATQDFQQVLAHQPRHAAAAALLALSYALRYTNDGRDEAWLRLAEASAKQALHEDDQLALAHAAKAWVLEYQGKLDLALLAYDRALRLDPSNLYALNGRPRTLMQQSRFSEAEASIKSAMQRHPRERLLVDLLGSLYYKQARYQEAEATFRRSIVLEADAVFAYANLNATLLRLNRPDEALQVLQQGLRIRPAGVLYSNLGTVLFSQGDYLAAAEAFEHAVSASKGSPNDYLKWANLADALRWLPGREPRSRAAYQRALQLMAPLLARAPDDPTYLSRAALYAARLGDAPQALALLARLPAGRTRNPDLQFRLCMAYELLHQRSQALKSLRQALLLGYPVNLVESEPDLMALRRDARYPQLILRRTLPRDQHS
ncbi:protein kinase [Chitinimonas sp. BJYL2]|uniref:protein kinase domain-containing protein n=1 Tax=Chitinimonas sp. BJYL2 TaxID=2976696 RepID=UPI0022B54FB4|nr:protein kinase [Chitinimonas sp. BJYL2]